MATTVDDLKGWFKRGKSEGATHMVVVCDTFDYDDYPSYCKSAEEARDRVRNPGSMQRVMEVYNLTKAFDDQICQGRFAMDFSEPIEKSKPAPKKPSSKTTVADPGLVDHLDPLEALADVKPNTKSLKNVTLKTVKNREIQDAIKLLEAEGYAVEENGKKK